MTRPDRLNRGGPLLVPRLHLRAAGRAVVRARTQQYQSALRSELLHSSEVSAALATPTGREPQRDAALAAALGDRRKEVRRAFRIPEDRYEMNGIAMALRR